jgi:hypothetical protein
MLLAACRGDGPVLSQMVVVIQADELVRASVDTLDVAIRSGSLSLPAESWTLRPTETFAGPRWPASLTLVPRGKASDTGVELDITAYQAGKVRLTRSVITQFIAGRSLYLEITLEGACLDSLSCGTGYTCAAVDTTPSCLAPNVDATMLPDYHGHDMSPSPGGEGGAGVSGDASVDAGARDAGPLDAGVSDGAAACVPSPSEDCANDNDASL